MSTANYQYDAFDRRLAKLVDEDGDGAFELIEGFVYKGSRQFELIEGLVYNGDAIHLVLTPTEIGQRYLYGPGVDLVLAEETVGEGVEFALTNHLNSVEFILDRDGQRINTIIYDSFGNVTSETNPDVDVRYGFTGRDLDEETGLDYYRARYYDPVVGRFLSEDPLGFVGGNPNLYGYVNNSPVNATDPSGLIPLPRSIKKRLGSDPGSSSGLHPETERENQYSEAQREWALGNIAEHAEYICDAAEHYNIPAEAIAGAILWEALENPYNWLRGQGPLIFTRPGGFSSYGILGKIHTEQGSIAEDVEDTVRQRLPEDFPSQREDQLPLEYSIYPSRVENRKHHLLTNPIVAIEHVAAIINILAKRYESEIDTQVQAEIQRIEGIPKEDTEEGKKKKQHKKIE